MKTLYLTSLIVILSFSGNSQSACLNFQDTTINNTVSSTQTAYGTTFYNNSSIEFKVKYFDHSGIGDPGDHQIADYATAGYTGSNGCSNFAGNIYFQGNAVTKVDFSNLLTTFKRVEFDINYMDTTLSNPFRINGMSSTSSTSGITQTYTKLTHGRHVTLIGNITSIELHGFEVAIDNLCIDSSSTVSIKEKFTDKVNFSIYPNPVSTTLSLKIDKIEPEMKLTFHNALGQQVKSVTSMVFNQIDVSDLKKGIYFVSLEREGARTKTLKLIKE